MQTQFNPLLVTVSILVAIFASYVALNLANNVTHAKGRLQALWLFGGALAMGIGIWSMHFIGMLAFSMPGMAMAYDIPLMLLSIVVAIGASALALYIISRDVVPIDSIVSGGIAMAAAIAGMHYIGMYSMRMQARIEWDIGLVVLSILIALVAAFGALLILTRFRDRTEAVWQTLFASTLMGIAVAGMHYTGMLAATFVHDDAADTDGARVLVSSVLAFLVIAMPLLILGLALAGSVSQRLFEKRNRNAREILGRSEERFRLLVAAVKDYAICILDPEGHITTWNLGAERITGYTEAEIIGKHITTFCTPDDLACRRSWVELNVAQVDGHFEGEGLRVRKDGSTYWASVVIAPLHDAEGKISGYSQVTRDITQVKESERRLRQLNEGLERRVEARTRALAARENQLRSIANAVPVLIVQLDRNECVTFANETFAKLFGKRGDELIGKPFSEVVGSHRYPLSRSYIKNVLAGNVTTFEHETDRSGTQTIFGVTLVPEFDTDGAVSGFIVVASDITKYKQIQAELKKAKEAADVANSTKSAFLANMSHEIRTPLGAVLGFSELLLDEAASPSDRLNSVEVIKRNGRLLSNIINDILDLSKVEAGKLEVEKVSVHFSEVMNEIGSVLSLEASAKGIELKVASDGLLPARIKTDPLRLRQILLNIVGNAIKFTNRGIVHVKVRLLTGTDGAPKLAFTVTDTGVGITPDQVERLFMPFSQADVSTTRKFGGTGLGLVLSKRLANILGGDVVLTESVPGKGSTFTVTIDPGPAEQVLFQTSERPAANVVRITPGAREKALIQFKILVADDSLDNQALIKRILKAAGASVETANNGREAVDKALGGDFSLVLMDLQMPEMDGYEATKALRQNGFTKPIIALTAHAMKEERQRSLQNGFDDHITKPIDHKSLVRTLSTYPA